MLRIIAHTEENNFVEAIILGIIIFVLRQRNVPAKGGRFLTTGSFPMSRPPLKERNPVVPPQKENLVSREKRSVLFD